MVRIRANKAWKAVLLQSYQFINVTFHASSGT